MTKAKTKAGKKTADIPAEWTLESFFMDPVTIITGYGLKHDSVLFSAVLKSGLPFSHEEAKAILEAAPKLYHALAEAVEVYGKPGGPWNVPGSAGSWIAQAKSALKHAGWKPPKKKR